MPAENGTLKLSRQSMCEFSFCSMLGTREEQQDAFGMLTEENIAIACVCDGMGGHKGGAAASRTAVEIFLGELERNKGSLGEFYSSGLYLDILDKTDNAVANICLEDGRRADAGTTLVSVIITDMGMSWLAVGDSSIYILRKDNLIKINQDHNYKLRLDEELEQGAISREKYDREMSRGNALISYIGMGGVELYDVSSNPIGLRDGDMIMLCSDGLTKFLSDGEIKSAMTDRTAKKAVDALMEIFKTKSSSKPQDNTTAIVIKINKEV